MRTSEDADDVPLAETTLSIELQRPDADHYRIVHRYGDGDDYPDEAEDVPVQLVTGLLRWAGQSYHARTAPARTAPARNAPVGAVDRPEPDELLVDWGRRLFDLLDGPRRLLTRHLDRIEGRYDTVVLAIGVPAGRDAAEGLVALPWELLHDGTEFLVLGSRPVLPVRRVRPSYQRDLPRADRLRLVFMACAPADPGLPELDYDAESYEIEAIADDYPLLLVEIEDSGDLAQLQKRLNGRSRSVDVLHLTGHAERGAGGPVFCTEGPTGERVDATAATLLETVRRRRPRLLCLAGCATADAPGDPDTPFTGSLAEQLCRDNAAQVVLGWARPVGDTSATRAAGAFYQALAQGRSVAEALGDVYRGLAEAGSPYWHLLRTFVQGELPGRLVPRSDVPGRGRWRRRRPPDDESIQFRFIGRRRELQEAIRLLRPTGRPTGKVGLVLHGLGGVGKTWLARRIADRLDEFDVVRVVGGLDQRKLGAAVTADEARRRHWDDHPTRPLVDRLEEFLRGYVEGGPGRPVLFDLDAFEVAFQPDERQPGRIALRDGAPLARPEAAAALEALVEAVRRTSDGGHRILMTTRYEPALPCIAYFTVRQVHEMNPFDQARQARRVATHALDTASTGGAPGPAPSAGWLREVQRSALSVAAGNPRLLDWLVTLAFEQVSVEPAELHALMDETKRHDFLEDGIFLPLLRGQLSGPEAELLAAAAPFEVAVPLTVLARLCRFEVADAERLARRLSGFGLLECVDGAGWPRFAVPGVLRLAFTDDTDQVARRRRHADAARELAAELGEFAAAAVGPDAALVREVTRLAVRGRDRALATDSAAALVEAAQGGLRFSEVQALCEEILAIWTDDHRFYLGLAEALRELGRSTAEHLFQRALDVCPPDQPAERASVLAARGFWGYRARPEPAAADLAAATELARAAEAVPTLVFALRTTARLLAEQDAGAGDGADDGADDGARDRVGGLLAEALALAQELADDGAARAAVLLDRAIAVHLPAKRVAAAEGDLREALRVDEATGAILAQAIALLTLADAALDASRSDELDPAERADRVALAEAHVDDALTRTALYRVRVKAALLRGEIGLRWHDVAGDRGVAAGYLEEAERHYGDARTLALGPAREGVDQDELPYALHADQLSTLWGALDGLLAVAEARQDATSIKRLNDELDTVEDLLDAPDGLIDGLARARDMLPPELAAARAREAATLAAAALDTAQERRAWQVFVDMAGAAGLPADQVEGPLRRLLELLKAEPASKSAGCLHQLGGLLLREQRLDEAAPVLESALRLYAGLGLRTSTAELHERLAEVARETGEPAAAERHLCRAARHRVDAHAPAAAARTLRVLAAVQRPRSVEEAARTLVRAARLARLGASGRAEGAALADLAGLVAAEPAAAAALPGWPRPVPDAARRRAAAARRRAVPLLLAVGADIESRLDPARGGTLLDRLDALRAEADVSSTLPPFEVAPDTGLAPTEFRIRVWGVDAAGELLAAGRDPDRQLLVAVRSVVERQRSALEGGEPAPLTDLLLDRESMAELLAALESGGV